MTSDVGGEFAGDLAAFMRAYGVRQYFTDVSWQNGLVEQNGGTWKSAARKAIKDVWSMGQSHLARAGETRFARLRHAVTGCTRKQE